jgi:pimeloyl-ACP methyl ester carboxylesterase
LNTVQIAARKLKKAVLFVPSVVGDRVGDFFSSKLLERCRKPLNDLLGKFVGDGFVYFEGRGDKNSPGPIPSRILTEIDAAVANVNGEPLILIGHSLGGVILFDLLSHYRPDLQVDLFVSVGSQVAQMEELKLFHTSDKNIIGPDGRAKTPQNIKHWINIFDRVDIFSYACDRVFDRVDVDAEYDTKTHVVGSHTEYFKQSRFYQHLKDRVVKL